MPPTQLIEVPGANSPAAAAAAVPPAEGIRAVFFPWLVPKPRVSGHLRKIASQTHLD